MSGPVRTTAARAVPIAAIVFALGCASNEVSSFPGPDGGTSSSSTSSGGFDTSPTDRDACSDAAKLVYVLSQENDLYSFAPNLLSFTKIGRMNCAFDGIASSMAVDRVGTAWVSFSNGKLAKVSTRDANCTETSFSATKFGFERFGMAFATNSETSTEETLYVSGFVTSKTDAGTMVEGKGFAKLSLPDLAVTPLGEYSASLAGKTAELTGTGDGRLYGFFTTKPTATMAQIDRANGATSGDRVLDGVDTGNAFAFSFWGGDFWFYTTIGSPPSKVTKLTTATGELKEVVANVGFRIVGAGVSTCAPITPPK